MALMSPQIATPQDSLAILKNVLKETCSPPLEIRQEICFETGLSIETIKSWFVKQNDNNLSVPQQEILKSYLGKIPFVTKKLSSRIAKETSLRTKTVLRWFIRQGCSYIKDSHIQLLQASFDRSPFLTKTTTIQLSKETKLTPRIICRWFVEEYEVFDNELESLIKPNSESKLSRAITQGEASKSARENRQRSISNDSQWHPEYRVTNCKEVRQSRSTCRNSFQLQKLQSLQNLLIRNGHFKQPSK